MWFSEDTDDTRPSNIIANAFVTCFGKNIPSVDLMVLHTIITCVNRWEKYALDSRIHTEFLDKFWNTTVAMFSDAENNISYEYRQHHAFSTADNIKWKFFFF